MKETLVERLRGWPCPSEWVLSRNGTYRLWPHPMGFLAERGWQAVRRPCAGSLAALALLLHAQTWRGQARQTQASGVVVARGLACSSAASQRTRQHLELDALCADIAGTLSLLMRVLHSLPFVHKANSNKVLGTQNPDIYTQVLGC